MVSIAGTVYFRAVPHNGDAANHRLRAGNQPLAVTSFAAPTLALRSARYVGLDVRFIHALLVSLAASVSPVRFLIRTVLVRSPFRHASLTEMRGSSLAHTPYPR